MLFSAAEGDLTTNHDVPSFVLRRLFPDLRKHMLAILRRKD